ncbi:MAG: DUF4012 domain-containing protein [Dehalococcoidia bacterium]
MARVTGTVWRLRRVRWLVAVVLGVLVLVEAGRWLSFYQHASRAQDSLAQLERQLDRDALPLSPEAAIEARERLVRAEMDLRTASEHVGSDPLMALARRLPVLRTQAVALTGLIQAAHSSAATGVLAAEVLVAYSTRDDDPERTAVQEGVAFIESQAEPMARVRESLNRTEGLQARIPHGLAGPLERRRDRLAEAVGRIDEVVGGYEQARTMLPSLLGFDRPRTYLVLAQNDTELFPSGGLISNYGIVTFDDGQLVEMRFEYFTELFRRWQQASGSEYIEPPAPLRDYLLRGTTWALGEAGWYPDFPTTAELARSFVEKGGGPSVDGVIAIDLRFVEALLRDLGAVTVRDYGSVRVSADNLDTVVLEQTRSETLVPGAAGKAFLSSLAEEILRLVFATPDDEWLGLIETLSRMGAERHLQLQFDDDRLQAGAREYGLDGGMADPSGDYLMLADTSVGSTKLNLILENAIDVGIRLDGTGARSWVAYATANPFDEWRQGRDPLLVRALMLDGVYGSYLRLYAPAQASLTDLWVDGEPAGPHQSSEEHGRAVFGRYTPLGPGETSIVEFFYESAGVVETLDDGWQRYRLYVQKQAGTRAIPLRVAITLPEGSMVRSTTLDGEPVMLPVNSDLRTDRIIEIEFRPPR